MLKEEGFALLLTLVAVSVILAVGLSLLQITLKQLTLASFARDSEVAISAASTGIECIRWSRDFPESIDVLLTGINSPVWACGEDAIPNPEGTSINHSPSNHTYNYIFQHDVGSDRCAETSLHLLDAASANADIVFDASEGLDQLQCGAGFVCTTIFSRGYNRPCDDLDSVFTVQRELTIQY